MTLGRRRQVGIRHRPVLGIGGCVVDQDVERTENGRSPSGPPLRMARSIDPTTDHGHPIGNRSPTSSSSAAFGQ